MYAYICVTSLKVTAISRYGFFKFKNETKSIKALGSGQKLYGRVKNYMDVFGSMRGTREMGF